jgi:hypothetical protein
VHVEVVLRRVHEDVQRLVPTCAHAAAGAAAGGGASGTTRGRCCPRAPGGGCGRPWPPRRVRIGGARPSSAFLPGLWAGERAGARTRCSRRGLEGERARDRASPRSAGRRQAVPRLPLFAGRARAADHARAPRLDRCGRASGARHGLQRRTRPPPWRARDHRGLGGGGRRAWCPSGPERDAVAIRGLGRSKVEIDPLGYRQAGTTSPPGRPPGVHGAREHI